MNWVSEKPRDPGKHLYRGHETHKPFEVDLVLVANGLELWSPPGPRRRSFDAMNGEWLGPLPLQQ